MQTVKERLQEEGIAEHALSIQERVALLEKSKLTPGLSWQELQTLAAYFDAYLAPATTYICREGEQSDFLCLICRGRVAVLKDDLLQKHKTIATVGPGQTVGEMSIVDGGPRSAAVQVQTEVLMLVLSSEQFSLMAEEVPRLWGKMLLQMTRLLSKRLRQTSGILAEYLQS